jgi:hypothetical protein
MRVTFMDPTEYKKNFKLLSRIRIIIFMFFVFIHAPGILAVNCIRAFNPSLYANNEIMLEYIEFFLRVLQVINDIFLFQLVVFAMIKLEQVKKRVSNDKTGFSFWIKFDVLAILCMIIMLSVLRLLTMIDMASRINGDNFFDSDFQ